MPDLSIIIVNTNNRKILEECLGSIYKNTQKISFEIIVTDNASTDGSQQMIKTQFPKVKLIENRENAGFIRASNQGLRIYQGRYGMLLNDDTVVKADALDRMVEWMDKNPKAGACGPRLLNTDGTPQRQGGLFSRIHKLDKPTAVDFVIGAALLVRREVIEKVGLMDENLFFYNDDLDWCIRIRKAGYKIYLLPQIEIVHYGGYSSKRVFKRRLFVEGFRGGLYFSKKHYGPPAYSFYRFILALGILLFIPLLIISYPLKPQKFVDRLLAYFDILKIALFTR
jgi:hypothetical protein